MQLLEQHWVCAVNQDEVRVKIASSGLCGSDLPRIFKNG
ncbi:hypothetical protein ACUODF_59915, partial [Escherichia coli]